MKKFVLFSCVACVALTSIVHAETITIPGVAAVGGETGATCSAPDIPTGATVVYPGPQCMLSYPLSIPVGKTIDSIEIAYDNATNLYGAPSITAYLGQNRVKPKLGAIAIAGASAQPPLGTQGFLNMPVNKPVASGSVYWVQIFDTGVADVNYVAVTFH